MDKNFIIQHMNGHHTSSLINIVKKFSDTSDVQEATLIGVDTAGLDIAYNGTKTLRVDFPQVVATEQIQSEIITLCKRVGIDSKEGTDTQVESVKKEIEEFKKGFGSVVLATLNEQGRVISSFAPLIQHNGRCYIYISSVAEHYHSIKANPNNIEAFFLEDECKAKSVILRKRLRYCVNARFIERESEEFEQAFSILENSMGGYGGVKQIKKMLDFSLVELQLLRGRFVKGFGQAYDIKANGEVAYVGANGNPHDFAK